MTGPIPATRARVYLCDSEAFEGCPAHALVYSAFVDTGVRDVSVHHGIMGFERSSGVLSSRPLRFHADLPAVVQAAGRKEDVEAALPEVRRVLGRGLITLTDVEMYEPGQKRIQITAAHRRWEDKSSPGVTSGCWRSKKGVSGCGRSIGDRSCIQNAATTLGPGWTIHSS